MADGASICGIKMKTLSSLKLVGNVYLMLSSTQLMRMAREVSVVIRRPKSCSS